jgi:translation initiation factor IF-2
MENTNEKKSEYDIRPPVVTVMGHVDHGKTSILDVIRKTDVAAGEYGGITQHIGAYQVTHNSRKITFIDTPGHEAFTQMRARGGKAADIVVLVVAADEGVKPQTKEAISHAKAASVPVIVAINKIDKAGANSQKVKQELASENILVEDWGGDVISVEVSAKEKTGLDKLLDAILLVADLHEIKGNPNTELEAVIIESKLDRRRGVVVTAIVKNGTLKIGQKITAGNMDCKIKSLMDDKGKIMTTAGPSTPVEILGFSKVPHVGDLLLEKDSELLGLSEEENRVEIIGKESKKTVTMVLKTDTEGTLEAVKGSLAKLISSSVEATYAIKFLHCGTGDINESDVALAQSAKGVVVGFDVRIPPAVQEVADTNKILVKTYKTIYELIEDAEKLLEGTATQEELKIKGRAKVLKLFKLPSGDVVVGCKVIAGALKTGIKCSVFDKDPSDVTKDDKPLFTGTIKNLKKGKDEVSLVGRDNECGVLFKPAFDDIQVGMWIEVK